MLHGIDISNWDKGLEIPESVDFAIIKATGGTNFVDPYCEGFVQQCMRKGILWGFYHFAGDYRQIDPEAEAIHFHEHTQGYNGFGIPVLDIESDSISNWGNYAQRFVDKYHAITGVWPVIYCQASRLDDFEGYPLVQNCGLWIAGYPDSSTRTLIEVPEFPYSVSPWPFAAMWQFSSTGVIQGYDGYVDLDVAYMDAHAWELYATGGKGYKDATEKLPQVDVSPEQPEKGWHFENNHVSVDVRLK